MTDRDKVKPEIFSLLLKRLSLSDWRFKNIQNQKYLDEFNRTVS